MKIWLMIGIVVVVVVLAIQLVPYGRYHANPPVLAEPNWNSPATRTTFMQAGGDCHSNETVWSWYTLMHPAAKLSGAARQTFIAGLAATLGGEKDVEREKRDRSSAANR